MLYKESRGEEEEEEEEERQLSVSRQVLHRVVSLVCV